MTSLSHAIRLSNFSLLYKKYARKREDNPLFLHKTPALLCNPHLEGVFCGMIRESTEDTTTKDVLSMQYKLEEVPGSMKAVKTHVGRCDTCGEPAAYAQLLPGGRSFRYCEQHVSLLVKKQAEAAAAAEKGKK